MPTKLEKYALRREYYDKQLDALRGRKLDDNFTQAVVIIINDYVNFLEQAILDLEYTNKDTDEKDTR